MVDRSERPIGVFDSGLGGLTVARALMDLLPNENLIYFGDTARCPYGPRPEEEVRRFAFEIMDSLVREDVKLLVMACNSAASAALQQARAHYEVPVLSVIEPGVRAAVAATRNRLIGVIGTVRTVESGAYDDAILATRANVTLRSRACPRFVEFVENGDTTSDGLIAVAEDYLVPLKAAGVDTLILGCTHYPLLSGVIHYVMGDDVVLISSAEVTATEVFSKLKHDDLLNRSGAPGKHRFIASGPEAVFGELGSMLLGPSFNGIEQRPWSMG
ncbi:MAG: glutamate racemase [Actinomycetota bacterium]